MECLIDTPASLSSKDVLSGGDSRLPPQNALLEVKKRRDEQIQSKGKANYEGRAVGSQQTASLKSC
jgi:hypothetical protein